MQVHRRAQKNLQMERKAIDSAFPMSTHAIVFRRAADWIIPVAGLARVQCPHPMAIRSLATPATVSIYVTAVRLRTNATR